MRYVQQHNLEQSDIITDLTTLLLLLFPKSPEIDITKVSKFVNKAIKLKEAMMEEQAVYHCYWVDGGDHYDESLVEIADEETGLISICTFPGLSRTVKNEDGEVVARAVKASAILQSAFVTMS